MDPDVQIAWILTGGAVIIVSIIALGLLASQVLDIIKKK